MIHLVDLPSLRSLNAVMHSGETETLSRGYQRQVAVRARVEDEGEHTLIGPRGNCVSMLAETRTEGKGTMLIICLAGLRHEGGCWSGVSRQC
jgi:hypothetical protein